MSLEASESLNFEQAAKRYLAGRFIAGIPHNIWADTYLPDCGSGVGRFVDEQGSEALEAFVSDRMLVLYAEATERIATVEKINPAGSQRRIDFINGLARTPEA